MNRSVRGDYVHLLMLAAVLTAAAAVLFHHDYSHDQAEFEDYMLTRARSHVRDIMLMRQWNAGYGGVYVEKKPGVETNPYLPDTDIRDTQGKTYALRNPAAMTREMAQLSRRGNDYHLRMTGLKLLNPANAPDPWEKAALEGLSSSKASETFVREESGNRMLFRYLAPVFMEESCMPCHAHFGLKPGDLRGGISISMDVTDQQAAARRHAIKTATIYVATISLA